MRIEMKLLSIYAELIGVPAGGASRRRKEQVYIQGEKEEALKNSIYARTNRVYAGRHLVVQQTDDYTPESHNSTI